MKNLEFGQAVGDGRIQVSEFGKSVIRQSACFILAGAVASSSAYEYFSPLGVAFCSGINRENTLFSCFGAMTGYIISNNYISSFRYVMALILVYVLRVYIGTFPKLRHSAFVSPAISLFSTLSTGLVSMFASDFTVSALTLKIAEAITSFGAAYFFATGVNILKKLMSKEKTTSKEMTGLTVALLLLILSMSGISILGITPSGVACSYIIIMSAYMGRESGGALIGISTSLGCIMMGRVSPVVFTYAGAGLFSGLFSYSGRVLCACAYIFSYGGIYLLLGEDNRGLEPLIETAIASFFFVITPRNFIVRLKMLFSASSLADKDRSFNEFAVSRVKTIRNAVCDMSETVHRVSQQLKEKSVPDTTAVYLRVRDNVCSDCGNYEKCWRSQMAATIGEFDFAMEEIRRKGIVTPSGTPMSLQSKCIRIMSLCDNFNKNYTSYSARLGAEGRINEMRKVTADQFDTVCEMLDDLLESFEKDMKPVNERSVAVKNCLDDMGVASTVNCYKDGSGNVFVNITVNSDCKATEEDLHNCVEKVMETDFSKPVEISNSQERLFMFYEKPPYSVECEFSQLSGKKNEMCGDYFESFYDGKGNFIAVLSDGMGRGNRAAVDSTMAASLFSRLIVSGFSFPCALRLVNSALLIKGHEESLATLDILKVNLYNGKTVIYKAGASSSILFRNGKAAEIKRSAMPIGLLRQAEFATVQGNLKDEDVVILMSDGATENSFDDIKNYILRNGYAENLSEKLCAVAKGKNIKHGDDVTVSVVKIRRDI